MRKLAHPVVAALLSLSTVAFLALPSVAAARDTAWPGETLDGRACTEFAWDHGFGPYDYTNARHRQEKLPVVENNHFTEIVRSLRSGENASTPLNDLEYTIGAFPNHHRALYSMVRYATEDAYTAESRQAWDTPTRSGRPRPPPECYLQRAIAFAPDDHRTRLLYGLFLHRKGAFQEAQTAYKRALKLDPDSPETHYNFGLLLVDMGDYQEAVTHARKAYNQGYPLRGLRDKLASHGYQIDR